MSEETTTTKIYTYDELSEEAKEKARDCYRGVAQQDSFWSELTIEDAKEIAATMGIEIADIYWSGFWSQGDGACFTGQYSYAKGSVQAIKKDYPTDEELHRIAEMLRDTQRPLFYQISATLTHRGHYYHDGCMHADTCYGDYDRDDNGPADDLEEALRDFARWIYKRLEAEYDYTQKDETVVESIVCNEYEFTEGGAIH